MKCRSCHSADLKSILDLGAAPLSNQFLTHATLLEPESWIPLEVFVCRHCWLVQTRDYVASSDVFTDDYAYFSSTSTTWVRHVATFAEDATRMFGLGPNSLVVEVACNDGILLEQFQKRGIPCLGVEPTASTASVAAGRGLPIVQEFLGSESASGIVAQHGAADLVVANNVIAHVPDLNDFLRGLVTLLKSEATLVLEFPRVSDLVTGCLFDTVYHEHYSYFSLVSLSNCLDRHGLVITDVKRLATHGGSYRIFARLRAGSGVQINDSVGNEINAELSLGVASTSFYSELQFGAQQMKWRFLERLSEENLRGSRIAAFGAAAKGNTFLNFCGVRADQIEFVVDETPAKIGRWMPGSRIPIVSPGRLHETPPDLVIVLAWNFESEIFGKLGHLVGDECRIVTSRSLGS
jgi:hypothetical protein